MLVAISTALSLWSAEVAITFKLAEGGTADLTFYKQTLPGSPGGTFQSFPELVPSQIGSNVESVPGSDVAADLRGH